MHWCKKESSARFNQNELKQRLRIQEMKERYIINKINKANSQTIDTFNTLSTEDILNQNLKDKD